MSLVKVKICGITSTAAAAQAALAGADALGLVFYAKSSRYLEDLELARDIALAAGPFVTTVGLFVDASPAYIERVLNRVPLNLLQFHGEEDDQACGAFARPFIKAFRMKEGLDVVSACQRFPSASGFLLDGYKPGVPGGTGEVFDWHRVPDHNAYRFILAGGLNPGNVAEAVSVSRPWAVDVSGGVESAPGVKDPEKIRAFIAHAKAAPYGADDLQTYRS